MTSNMSPLRPAGLIAVLVGAVGSLALMFHASQRTPRLLVVLFTIWVVSPFLVLLWVDMISKRWPVLTRVTLYAAMLAVGLGSLAVYGMDAYRPPKAQAAFVYVLVPPLSWLFIAVAVGIAAFISRGRSRRDDAP